MTRLVIPVQTHHNHTFIHQHAVNHLRPMPYLGVTRHGEDRRFRNDESRHIRGEVAPRTNQIGIAELVQYRASVISGAGPLSPPPAQRAKCKSASYPRPVTTHHHRMPALLFLGVSRASYISTRFIYPVDGHTRSAHTAFTFWGPGLRNRTPRSTWDPPPTPLDIGHIISGCPTCALSQQCVTSRFSNSTLALIKAQGVAAFSHQPPSPFPTFITTAALEKLLHST
ncbi:uncharacterized protein EV422DRAFT_117508 [Fimicolochytrium jonesii]|uniref:uncharacterized protein n=1 Tax=Fimicolochytrium jonesii TaxID=1396493 RepID=UPI0022FE1956|nr:uncharacterized protein EV422DRAFT_117508 [Fimicolochytrium jonesii]KAI8819106.1 hypothetical protein EV422DRAFT_117508 [Fimicolochytrium jonesii]